MLRRLLRCGRAASGTGPRGCASLDGGAPQTADQNKTTRDNEIQRRTLMSWTCPACQNAIRHSEGESAPRMGVTYRCPICRLELVVDPDRGKMTLAPMRDDDLRERRAPRGRPTADDRRR